MSLGWLGADLCQVRAWFRNGIRVGLGVCLFKFWARFRIGCGAKQP